MRLFKQLYLNERVFYGAFIVAVVYILAFFFPFLLFLGFALLLLLVIMMGVDLLLLFITKEPLKAKRILPEKLSNGDENKVKIEIKNDYHFKINSRIIDEIPFQFQKRDFLIKKEIDSLEFCSFWYSLIPKERGSYSFGSLNVFVASPLGLVSRKFIFQNGESVPCYPSFIHLREQEMHALNNEIVTHGLKKMRRLGHTMEFEQIKEYVPGDDVRTINWKATSKRNSLMVNQYQDEKAQRIYLVIDKGRTMQMPFNEMSLLDYAINSSMALSHVLLKKTDKVGVLAFAKKTENKIAAENKNGQLKKIAETLYHLETGFEESDFSRLYQDVKYSVSQRSLLLLFTNFETLDALHRQMKYLRAMAKNHLLVVVFFKNAEAQQLLGKSADHLAEVYDEIIAEKFEMEKKQMIQELRNYGIHAIYTLPEYLSIAVINKYLEIKARGVL